MHSTKDKGRDLDPALVKFYAFVLHAAGAILGGEIHLDVTSATKERCAIREIQRHNLEKTRTTIEIQKAMVIEGHLYLLNNASEDKIPHGAESPCEGEGASTWRVDPVVRVLDTRCKGLSILVIMLQED